MITPSLATDNFGTISDITSYISHYMQQPPQTKQPKLRPLVHTNDANAFWLYKGNPIHTILELRHAFDTMTQEQFEYHVHEEKNDFALWVQYVLQDHDCAEDMMRAKTRLGASRILFKHLKKYDIPKNN